ncbi:plasmid replication initiator TrfA [Pseudomonas sp. ES3-33]|uniref:plasmid replication initiator TrfA n=1 Tax=Pseudomonas sp. ES3-33 TaxID=1628833 RepID=UPI0006976981|nr:plasmid replication initiator TrfA [Pseudomonas sp. ES3-33]
MSDDSYYLDSLREYGLKTTYQEMLNSEMHNVLFGFRKGETAKLVEWNEKFRGVPNAILRSALFGAIGRGERATNLSKLIASPQGLTITHCGPQLDQADLDVWEQCLHMSRTTPLGISFETTAYQFLKAIGRDTGTSQKEWLKNSFMRLLQSTITVRDGDVIYAGHLIHDYLRNEKTGRHCITINPKIVSLYGKGKWTLFEWKDRMALRRHPLAQWLHGFYLTHAKSFYYKVETIHKLCGSKSKNVNDFKKDIRKAFTFMDATIGWKGEINDKGLITMTRPISRAQQRHLRHKLPY